MNTAPLARDHATKMRKACLAYLLGILLLGGLGGAVPVAGAAPHGIIFDPSATPSWIEQAGGGTGANDAAEDVVIAPDGTVFVAGSYYSFGANSDASLMKLVDGAPAWPAPRTYDGPAHGADHATQIALGPNGSVYTAGASTAANGKLDFLVIRWSASGSVLWARRYDGPAHASDQCTAIGVDAAGNVVVAGLSESVGPEWAVVSWSPAGVKRWAWRYKGDANAAGIPYGLVVSTDGSAYVTGSWIQGVTAQALTVRLSSAGALKWKKSYAGPEGTQAVAYDITARPAGGVFVCGACVSAATGVDGLVMSYTPAGARQVFALDTGPGGLTTQRFSALAVTSTGQVVAVGSSESGGNQDCHLATFTKDGTIAGKVTWPGAWDDAYVDVAADAFGGFYVTGVYRTAADKTAVLTQRGSVLTGGGGWSSLWAPAFVSQHNEPAAIAVRGATAVVAGTCRTNLADGDDQLVLGFVY